MKNLISTNENKERMNELKELAKLVKEMRDAQKAYFKSRHKNHLDRSKMLEAKVDAETARVLTGDQKALF